MKLKLIEKREVMRGVVSFIWEPEEPLTWTAGQYLHYTLPHDAPDERGIERWFTIASAPYEKHPMITTRFVDESTGQKSSSFKKALHALAIGDTIEADGPEGDFILDDLETEYVFIVGGIGVTPFHSMLKELDHSAKRIKATILYGNRDQNIVYKGDLDMWSRRNPNLKVHYILAPEVIGEETIKKYVPDLEKPIFYVSGPEPMVEALGKTLEGMGIPKEHIKQDFFPGYPAQ